MHYIKGRASDIIYQAVLKFRKLIKVNKLMKKERYEIYQWIFLNSVDKIFNKKLNTKSYPKYEKKKFWSKYCLSLLQESN